MEFMNESEVCLSEHTKLNAVLPDGLIVEKARLSLSSHD